MSVDALIRQYGYVVAANTSITDAEGNTPEGRLAEAARTAILAAAEEAGGSPMLRDDDFYLDQEGPGGDMDQAAEVMRSSLLAEGFDARIVAMMVCPTCEGGQMSEWCLTCKGDGFAIEGTEARQET